MIKCPFCGTDNQPGDTFCSNCGGYLDASSPATVMSSGSQPTIVSSNSQPTIVSNSTNNYPTVTAGGSGGARKLAPGDQLQNGRYVVEDILGEGGMGAAVRARDKRVNKQVVIKELLSDSTDPQQHQEDVRNFELEVETLSKLDHPLVPSVSDSFQENTHYFMVQDYVAGENLEKRMERVNQPMPEREALLYTSQVLDILDYLSEQNPPLVHRDIKPANIIIVKGKRSDRAYLVDFGIARAQANKNAKRKQTTALGTPGYAPPEQYQGNADERSDLYALAATLHHLLTNRDPRNYPPFIYPPARSINPQLSPDIERVLERALKINANERYQNAAAMKHDIDEILAKRFGTSGPIDAYTQTTASNPAIPPTIQVHNPVPAASTASAASVRQQQQQQQASYPQPRPMPQVNPLTPLPTAGTFGGGRQQGRSHLGRNLGLLLVVVLLIGVAIFAVPRLGGKPSPVTPTVNVATPIGGGSNSSNPISVTKLGNEVIGVSDGSYTFDTSRVDSKIKQQATDKIRSGDKGSAVALLNEAIGMDNNDAEALIYQEDLKIAAYPYFTLVVGSMPSGKDGILGVARDDMEGAYVAQKEFNDNPQNNTKMRLLIASSGSTTQGANQVASQIAQLAKTDPTFLGVMGWPYSNLAYSVTTNQNMIAAHIPIVSETASSDQLTNSSPYFFRVAPSNKQEGVAGAKYAETTMAAKNVAVFSDPSDLYSQSLAQDFTQQFTADGGKTTNITYTVGQPSTIQAGVQQAIQAKPDIIYFAGHSSDVAPLLNGLQSANAPDSLYVLGGDALYELGGYQGAKLSRLRFTAFAYPDEWDVLGLTRQKPAFFTDYSNDFDPNNAHSGYGFNRPSNDAILAYDAATALAKAYSNASAKQSKVTFDSMQSALKSLSFQGVSGYITFGPGGDPVNKALVILQVDNTAHIHMVKVINKFTNG